jgi:hypothetical protein
MKASFSIPLTPAQFAAARVKLSAQFPALHLGGTPLPPGDSGVIEQRGVKLDYSYNGVDSLAITIEHKPLFYPEGRVEAVIRGWFTS